MMDEAGGIPLEYNSFLEEVRGKIDDLEQAIKDVAEMKSKLKATASDVKTHIRENISRHLEALRNREVWLVNQVEIIQNIKEEILRQQHAELNQGLGQLAGAYCLIQQGQQSGCSYDLQTISYQIHEVLKSLEFINMAPDESSDISFVSDNFNMLQAITQYGRVGDSDSAVEQKIASSLEELKLDQHSFFHPGGTTSDWLSAQHKGLTGEWHFQAHSDISSDEFILVPKGDLDHALSDVSSEVEKIECESEERVLKPLSHLFTIMESDSADWILKQEPAEAEEETTSESPVIKTYEEIKGQGMEKWLAKNSAKDNTVDMIETYRQIASSEMKMWIRENQPSPKEIVTTPLTTYVSIMKSKMEHWLRNKEEPETQKMSLIDQYDEIANSDSAQWLAPASVIGVSDEEPMSLFPPLSEDPADWLLGRTSVPSTVPFNKTFPGLRGEYCYEEGRWLARPKSAERGDSLKAVDLETWLYNSEKSKSGSSDPSRVVTYYLETTPGDYNQWLAKPKASSDLCRWLSRQSIGPCKNCPQVNSNLFPVFDEVSNSSSGWLITDW